MMMPIRCGARQLAGVLLLLLAMGGVGCAQQPLRGVVMAGNQPSVQTLRAGHARLADPGLSDVRVELLLDPSSLSPRKLGERITDANGRFEFPVDAVGAGSWQEYELGVLVKARGFRDVWQTMPYPGHGQELLIVIVPGSGGDAPPRDILQDTLRYQDQLMTP